MGRPQTDTNRPPLWLDDIAELVTDRWGMVLDDEGKKYVLRPHVENRSAHLGVSEWDYLRKARANSLDGAELDRLIGAVMVGETYFYRDGGQLEALVEHLTRGWEESGEPPSVWCPACATGEEPYTLAMLFARSNVPARLFATDINRYSLRPAALGSGYGPRSVHNLPADLAQRYIEKKKGRFAVREALRRMVRFDVHNILDRKCPAVPWGGAWHAIVCRNLFIYFREDVIVRVSRTVAKGLKAGGVLVLGAHDALGLVGSVLERVEIGGRTAFINKNADESRSATPRTEAIVLRREGAPEAPAQSLSRDEVGWDQVVHNLVRKGCHQLALTILDEELARFREPRTVLLAACLELRLHDFKSAQVRLTALLRGNYEPATVYLILGLLHRKRGDHCLSDEALELALKHDTRLWPAAYLVAGSAERRGDLVATEILLERCLEGLNHGDYDDPVLDDIVRNVLGFGPEFIAVDARRRLVQLHKLAGDATLQLERAPTQGPRK